MHSRSAICSRSVEVVWDLFDTRTYTTMYALIRHTSPSTPFSKLNWKVLEHPAYSPNLAPSDFHLFGPLKNALSVRRFAAHDEVKEAVQDVLRSQPQIFFSNGIKKLTDRWA